MAVVLTQNALLAQQKLAEFERIKPEFEHCFRFVQEVHGQRRFFSLPVRETVYYLHALWICECKDRLLSIYRNIARYEGTSCLDLLQQWQRGSTVEVVAFLQWKLDGMVFADLTAQIQQVRTRPQEADGLLTRLLHGRQILLNRGMNLLQALDSIFALAERNLRQEVREACEQFDHSPEQLEEQLATMRTALYAYVPHPLLARQNMLVMNKLGTVFTSALADLPERRSWRVVAPREPLPAQAEHVVAGYRELTSPLHNNLHAHRFVDRPEYGDGLVV